MFLGEHGEDLMIAAVTGDSVGLHKILQKGLRPTYQVYVEALTANSNTIADIPRDVLTGNKGEELMLISVNDPDSYALSTIIDMGFSPSIKLYKAAVSASGFNVRYISKELLANDEDGEEIMIAAVTSNSYAQEAYDYLSYIKYVTPRVQEAARKNGVRVYESI